MSLPAASAPIAVLVLAWDEAAPAVRALVEAPETTETTLDSVVVLVPASPATDELTPEEFLPLEDSILSAELSSLTASADELPPVATPTTTGALPVLPTKVASASISAALPATTPEVELDQVALGAEELPEPFLPATAPPTMGLVGPDALTAAALNGPAVRFLRLSEYSLVSLAEYTHQTLPALAWMGATRVPATPYLGSSAVEPLLNSGNSAAAKASLPTLADLPPVAAARIVPAAEAILAASYLPAELPTALDAEPDATPTLTVQEPASTASASTTELSEAAADELADSFTVDVTPVQANWPEALASLQAPALLPNTEKPAPAPASTPEQPALLATEAAASPVYAALLPSTNQFDAPNLNFQIIQYARFAVPLALATQPFSVIYAPAWPTWLAAQELRQRTGLPLVLHLAALAAEDEPLDLAAGWPAEIQRQALHRADLILTETPALAHRLRRELGLPAHRVRTVPAADTNAVAQALSTVQL